MSKEHRKKKIINLRASVTKEREQKKRNNEYYADRIRSASSPSSRAFYRKSKIDKSAYHDRETENYRSQIKNAKASLKKCK